MSLYWGSDYILEGNNKKELKNLIEDKKNTNLEVFNLKNINILKYNEDSLIIRIQSTGRKDSNILKVIDHCFTDTEYNKDFTIKRIKTWAKDIDGKRISYFKRLV